MQNNDAKNIKEETSFYGLPPKVIFCKKCVLSNQRPSSYPEFKHTKDRITPTLHIDSNNICDACKFAEIKKNIEWKSRESELLELLDQHRSKNNSYDCIVPGSGGKDSAYASHILKYKYGMNPLTVTWPPIMYTDYGYENFKNWIEIGGFDNITFKPNGRIHKLLTKLAIQNLLHPFQTFILGQKNLAVKIALKYKIPLIFYGESEAEYGNPIAETTTALRDSSYYLASNLKDIYISGLSLEELKQKHNVSLNDISCYLPALPQEFDGSNIQVRYLGYYLNWVPQESFYYAVKNTGFKPRPYRTCGTYSKYASIDDKIDDLHYYTTYIKFGLGRATYDASQEIRNGHITRDEGVSLVHKFDGEFPEKYLKEIMDYLEMDEKLFLELCDRAHSPHLWNYRNGKWELRFKVNSL